MRNNKKGVLSIYFVFILLSIIIILIGTVVAPLGAEISSKFYIVGQDLMSDANETIQNISDPTVKAEILDLMNTAMSSQENNITVTTSIYKYSAYIVIALVGMILFIVARQLTQSNTGFI